MKYNRTRVADSFKTEDALYYTSSTRQVSQKYSFTVGGLGTSFKEGGVDPNPGATFHDKTGLKDDLFVPIRSAPGIVLRPNNVGGKLYSLEDAASFRAWLTPIALDYFQSIFEATARPTYSYIPQTKRVRRGMSDVVTKGFKRKSLKGEIVNNPMEQDLIEVEIPLVDSSSWVENIVSDGVSMSGSYYLGSGTYYITIRGEIPPSLPLCSADVMAGVFRKVQMYMTDVKANPQNAVNSAYGNINVGDIQALVTAGEGRETLLLLQQTISRFVKVAKAFKSGNWSSIAPRTLKRYRQASRSGKAVKIADFSQDAWMEARYAWRPLIGEAQAALDLLNGKRSLSPRQTFRGSDSAHEQSTSVGTFVAHGFTYTIEFDSVDTQYCRAGVLCQAQVTDLVNELSLTNLVDAAIDLTPFSFVLQWFINIGGLMYHLRPSGGYKVQAAWVTTVTSSDITGTISYVQSDGTKHSNTFRATKSHVLRTPGSTPTLFSIDLNLDLSKIIDLIAILRNLSR